MKAKPKYLGCRPESAAICVSIKRRDGSLVYFYMTSCYYHMQVTRHITPMKIGSGCRKLKEREVLQRVFQNSDIGEIISTFRLKKYK